MNATPSRTTLAHPRLKATVACVIGSLLSAWAVADNNPPDAQTSYQQQVAECNSGRSHQDRSTCLREAGAARDAAAKHKLADPAADYKANALQRCRALPQADRADCEARMRGDNTTTSGSVEDGGVIRERRTTEIGTPSQPAR